MVGAVQIFQMAAIEQSRRKADATQQRHAAEAERSKHEADRDAAPAPQRCIVEAVAGALSQLSQGDLTVRLQSAFSPEYE